MAVETMIKQVQDLTECAICLGAAREPKCLACLHTFCLECLEQTHTLGSTILCPVCRRECEIPDGGLHKLPNDFKVKQLELILDAVKSIPGGGESEKLQYDSRNKLQTHGNVQESSSHTQCAQDIADVTVIGPLAKQLHKLIKHDSDEAEKFLHGLSKRVRNIVAAELVDDRTALYMAELCKNYKLMGYLLETCSVDPDQLVTGFRTGKIRTTVLLQQSHCGDAKSISMMKNLVGHGASVNKPNESGLSPLMIACHCGNMDGVQYLVGLDATIENKPVTVCDWTALVIASGRGHTDIVKYLLSQGAGVNNPRADGLTGLMAACFDNHADIVEVLLEHGADVNQQDKTKRSPLMFCLLNVPNPVLVRLLVSRGADINLVNMQFTSALALAVTTRCVDAIKTLAFSGADTNIVDHEGNSPLHLAVQHKLPNDMIRLLLAHGADPTIRNKQSQTVCDLIPGGIKGWIVKKIIKSKSSHKQKHE